MKYAAFVSLAALLIPVTAYAAPQSYDQIATQPYTPPDGSAPTQPISTCVGYIWIDPNNIPSVPGFKFVPDPTQTINICPSFKPITQPQ